MYSAYDALVDDYACYKVETIGDGESLRRLTPNRVNHFRLLLLNLAVARHCPLYLPLPVHSLPDCPSHVCRLHPTSCSTPHCTSCFPLPAACQLFLNQSCTPDPPNPIPEPISPAPAWTRQSCTTPIKH